VNVARSAWVRSAIGLAVSVVCVWLVVRNVHPAEVWAELSSAEPAPLALAALLFLVGHLLRTWRWQTIVGPARFGQAFSALMIGALVNNIAPLRIGELVRVYLLHRDTGVSRGSLLTTVALERTLDGLFLVGGLAILIRVLPFPGWALRAGLVVGLVFLTAAMAMALASSRRLQPVVQSLIAAYVPGRIAHVVTRAWLRVGAGVEAMRDPPRAALVAALTLCVWALEAGGAYLVLASLGSGVPPTAALLLTVGVGLGGAIPSGPSAVGTYELLVVSSLAVFGLAAAPALAVAALLHVLAFVVANLCGLAALATRGVSLGLHGRMTAAAAAVESQEVVVAAGRERHT
jgi:uncharacterized protein (TIRG00374 family)